MTQINLPSNEGFQYASTLRGLVERIAFQLGDSDLGSEYDAYDEHWIRARVVDTMKWLQGRKPSLFSAEKDILLEPGITHKRPEDCGNLIGITTVHDDKGRRFPVCEADYKDIQVSRRWSHLQPSCMTDFPIYTFAFNANNMDEFVIDPQIQKPTTVTVTCSDIQRFLDDPDLEIRCDIAKYFNTIIEYVMYVAMTTDSENVTIAALADKHRQTFFDLAPIRQRQSDDRDS